MDESPSEGAAPHDGPGAPPHGDAAAPAHDDAALPHDDAAGSPAATPEDDLEGFETPMSRLLSGARSWLALVVAASLILPFGAWAIDEYAFGSAATEVESQLGEDAGLVDSLLLVRSSDCAGRTSTGSAFVVELDGATVVVTNRHVVESARTISLRALEGGPAIAVAAHRVSPDADVAVLEPAEPIGTPTLDTGGPVEVDDEVRVVGFPSGRPAFSRGRVAEAGTGRLLLALRVDPGASGSPVLDTRGRVVGQVRARTDDGDGVATPLAELRRAVAGAAPAEPCDEGSRVSR